MSSKHTHTREEKCVEVTVMRRSNPFKRRRAVDHFLFGHLRKAATGPSPNNWPGMCVNTPFSSNKAIILQNVNSREGSALEQTLTATHIRNEHAIDSEFGF